MLTIDYLNASYDIEQFSKVLSVLRTTVLTDQKFGEILRARLHNGWHTLIAVEKTFNVKRIVGTAAFHIESKFLGVEENKRLVCHVEDVAVLPEKQKRGVGWCLMNEIKRKAKDAGCYKIILDCSENNIQFYEKCGFTSHEIEMRLDL